MVLESVTLKNNFIYIYELYVLRGSFSYILFIYVFEEKKKPLKTRK